MTVKEKRKKLDDYCTFRQCSNCKIGVKLGDGNHPCGNGYGFTGICAVDDATVENYYDIVFGEKEKTVTLNAEKFIDIASDVLVEMQMSNPAILFITDTITNYIAQLSCELFHEKEGE